MKKQLIFFLIILILPSFVGSKDKYIMIKDMRGIIVKVPANLTRVATIDDGFIEGVMTHLGVIDKVKAIGSWSIKRDYKYRFKTVSGESYTLKGWNTMKYLHPWLNDLPCINSPQGNIINYETLVKSNPELVILRVGDCTIKGKNKENLNKTISVIEALGLPLIILYSPTYYGKADLSSMKEEMRVLGEVFGQKDKALRLYNYLNSTEKLIKERTGKIRKKVSVLYLSLNPATKNKGSSGTVSGINTPESYIIESIVNAKNAYSGVGSSIVLSAEQIYTINPDIIILPTSNGYHPSRELYESPDYINLQELGAVKNKRIYSMPWSPMNCARRVEYPIDMLIIAKASYPKLFQDIKIHEFVLKFYKDVYNVTDKQAKELRTQQILDWTLEDDF